MLCLIDRPSESNNRVINVPAINYRRPAVGRATAEINDARRGKFADGMRATGFEENSVAAEPGGTTAVTRSKPGDSIAYTADRQLPEKRFIFRAGSMDPRDRGRSAEMIAEIT